MAQPLTQFLAPIRPKDVLSNAARAKMPLQHGRCDHSKSALLSWDRLCEMAVKANHPEELRVSSNRNFVPLEFLRTGEHLDRAKLDRLLEIGASVVLESAHRFDENLAEIVRDFIAESGKPARLGAIGSTGNSGALKKHSDPMDLLLVQIDGAKHWRLYAPDDETDEAAEHSATPPKPVMEHTLREGEFLFVPAGTPHECDTVGGRSLHVGLGFTNPNYNVWG
ncbi:JmjC domain-containing protein [Erythrobacter sp. MTPC3]|uniref:JmjC domain-containing protein n=1 Tax=Erythrobacter sp. MTPC3 TaxID=3056564 RepID=UPI0036F27054